jgi:hypothetical protein
MPVTRWILDPAGAPVPCDDVLRWSAWVLDVDNRIIARTFLGSYTINTLFMGLDQEPVEGLPPALWESEVRNDHRVLPEYRRRYRSREAAELGHRELVLKLRPPPREGLA